MTRHLSLLNHAAGRRIGLLGGSFNPAHEGHLFISRLALERLFLDEVWWLVAPQNPLKPLDDMAPFEERLRRTDEFADHPGIIVTGLERDLGTRFTVDTIARLQIRAPQTRFVWLMGADNLATIHHWHRWQEIFESVPVAVFDRAPYSFSCLASRAAVRYRRHRLPASRARALADVAPPVWTFVLGPRHPASATAIRAGDRSFGFAGQDD
ncbi:MAG: nicotinate-nucleotide adenylyltransferase [Rhodospirillaceae bacterium]|nr:nicotinate-nucleotide adenylyltransferase [Rhodospirillaceae bacterium]MBT6202532.1 nicotinate-nucleotide adenylyltransferase [Rhodospirillaceae bacterium]MBT6512733.1 nicotinate-nucleotide adenylyltransferase [Rhodospirillaceae bacterium]MBT7613355.1 nicotinate-nucleotide adenylyltransferase [Rhodospirillaceae bacterium]